MKLFESETKLHKVITIVNIVFAIILVGSMITEIIIIPNWLRYVIYVYLVLLILYMFIRYRVIKKMRLKNYLMSVYERIQQMSIIEKNDFAMSDEAIKYFETLEMYKSRLTQEEFSKYKTVLFGTEDPYIVTGEGEIIVKAKPGDMADK